MRKLPVIVAYHILLALVLIKPAQAEEASFDTTYNIEYSVDNSLVVSVKENIGVINQTAGAVPSSFIETITNISIYDIKVLDSQDKEIQSEVEIKEGQKETVIRIPINDPAVGKAKKTQVTLYYKTKDLAGKTGRILNLHIPKAPISNYIQEYNVQVKIPRDFGPQISVTPSPVEEKMEEEGYILIFNKQTLEAYGISASFGDYQIFDFKLTYKLKNTSFFTKTMSATVPLPLENYQEISLTEITPKPTKLSKDGNGNILATFRVGGKKDLNVIVTGTAKVYTSEAANAVETETEIPSEFKKFTQPQPYWETKNRELMELAANLTSKDKSTTQNAMAIYSYITKTITYDFDQAKTKGTSQTRKGALATLKEKKGLCLDFTDLFITLSRAAGIPAREVDGYAYAKDFGATPVPASANLLHSWAQYYNPTVGWVAVDPTWGATSGLDYFSKLDNNHLAFSVKGLDSQNPQPTAIFTINFSADDYFDKTSLYPLDKLNQEGIISPSPLMLGGFVLALGLCTTLTLLIARSKRRYK